MAYHKYICHHCGRIIYCFDDEIEKYYSAEHHYRKLPPEPYIIHTTDVFMNEPMLDSMETAKELDRILTMEARWEREMKYMDKFRKEV